MCYLFRVYFVPTDIGIYLTAIIMIGLTQLLIWSIARYSSDIEIWRCLAFSAVAGVMAMIGMTIGGLNGLFAGWAFGAFAGFLIGGYIYDFELWQRITVAVVAPVFAFLSFFTGYWLKGLVFEKVFS